MQNTEIEFYFVNTKTKNVILIDDMYNITHLQPSCKNVCPNPSDIYEQLRYKLKKKS